MNWSSIFGFSVPVEESIVRGTVTFFVVFVLMRVVGQRESGGLGLTDVLLVVLMSEAAAAGLQGSRISSVSDGTVLVATVLFWSVSLDALAYRFPRIAGWVKARPRPLIEDGTLNRKVMLREFMTYDEVMSQLRLHGVDELASVERAYVEPNGMISIIRVPGPSPD
ncbi:hypothetical protein C5O27_04105 [Gordonia alkanivorans]|uniref:DUF421 domain-containing protein n=1 Tax=Gordonia alkanivorans TaxID=84096 RepID=UPI000FDE2D55|nr:YetF domain-containing protein [Gordonia alkanivorans]AZZ80376.1 hypothetical protein C5O27_04105 [Gordonia alkanivorans]